MKKSAKTLEFKIERTIPAPVAEVFDGWLNPKILGNTWNAADKYMLNAEVDGLFFWRMKGICHYGRFTKIQRPTQIHHTWVSPNTMGEETNITVTFKKQGENTLMTLIHSDIPNTESGKSHKAGWNYFMGIFLEQFGKGSRKKYRFEEAHPPKR